MTSQNKMASDIWGILIISSESPNGALKDSNHYSILEEGIDLKLTGTVTRI